MFEKVIELLNQFTEKPIQSAGPNTTLAGDLDLNSLDVVNIVVAFEDAFDIEIPDREISRFQTIGDIISYLERHT